MISVRRGAIPVRSAGAVLEKAAKAALTTAKWVKARIVWLGWAETSARRRAAAGFGQAGAGVLGEPAFGIGVGVADEKETGGLESERVFVYAADSAPPCVSPSRPRGARAHRAYFELAAAVDALCAIDPAVLGNGPIVVQLVRQYERLAAVLTRVERHNRHRARAP